MLSQLRTVCVLAVLGALLTLATFQASRAAPTELVIYADSLSAGWENWSWGDGVNLAATAVVHAGTQSVSVSLDGWEGLSFRATTPQPRGSDNVLSFWIHGGGSANRTLRLYLQDSNNTLIHTVMVEAYVTGGAVAANEWREVRVPLDTLLQGQTSWSRLTIQEGTGATQPTFYIDDVRLTVDGSLPTSTATATPTVTPTPAPAGVTVDAATTLRTIPSELGGSNVAVWNADERIDRPEVRARLIASGISILRFPGGSSSDEYHWRDHLPPTDDWQVNTDSYLGLLDQMGAEGMITVNFGSGTAQEAADWVDYVNNQKGANVRYWEVGNEIYGEWETSWTHDGRAYIEGDATHDGFNDFCHAMKAVDPTIKVGLIGLTNRQEYNGWMDAVLTYADRDCTDFIAIHRYPLAPSNNDANALLADPPVAWPTVFSEVRAAMQESFGRELPIMVTEYNSHWTEPPTIAVQTVNLLYLADTLGQIALGGAAGANHWDVMNNRTPNGGDYGILLVDSNFRRQPSYYLFPLWDKMGDRLVEVTSNTPKLRVYASRHGADGDVALLLINQGQGLDVTLNLQNFQPAASGQAWQAVGSELSSTTVSWNGLAEPPDDLSQVPPLAVPIAGTTSVVTLPATSVTVLRIPVSGDACAVSTDVDCSGRTDIVDIQRCANAWQATPATPGYVARCDLETPTDSITLEDILMVVAGWGP